MERRRAAASEGTTRKRRRLAFTTVFWDATSLIFFCTFVSHPLTLRSKIDHSTDMDSVFISALLRFVLLCPCFFVLCVCFFVLSPCFFIGDEVHRKSSAKITTLRGSLGC